MKKAGVLTLLVLLSTLVYFNSLGNGFHFDDYHHIVDNPHLKNIRNIPSFFSDTTKFSSMGWANHYRPLLLVTHTLNYYYGRLQPAGYHAVNLAFHIGSAFLVFLIVQAMLGTPPLLSSPHKGGRNKVGGGSPTTYYLLPTTYYSLPATYIPLASALIFAVHPFNSEVVNYVTARSSVMSAFFYLLAFYCWVKYRQAAGSGEQVAGSRLNRFSTTYYLLPTTYFYIASLLAFLLGMLTKEVVITLPIMLWLYDLYFNRPPSPLPTTYYLLPTKLRTYTPYIPFVVLVAIPYLVLSGPLTKSLIYGGGLPRSYYVNLLTQAKALVRYMQMLFIPVNLSVDHVVPNSSTFREWEVVASTALLSGILILVLRFYRHGDIMRRIVSFFMVWFFVTLLPTTIIPLDAILQENRAYLAGTGFAVIIGIILGRGMGVAADKRLEVRSKKLEVRRYVSIALIGMLLVVFSIMTIQRNRVWKDELILWTDAVYKYPSSPRAHFALANFYKRGGDAVMAIKLYKKTLVFDPEYYEAYNNLGVLYYKEGEMDLAIGEFKKALSIMPAHLNTRMGLGKAYLKKGEMGMAEREFKTAIELARLTRQDRAAEGAASYLKWIEEKKR